MMNPVVGVVMGSSSDWDTMQHAVQVLQQFGVAHEARVVSAHRMPDDLFAYAEGAEARGLRARLHAFRAEQTAAARAMTLPPAQAQ